ncbi:protein PHYTOCHROME KINASE SUBSTRATE 4 [Malania oleifera]|uniref:protein PHYTOCHROME KINASE SUBSTRATE 4 n=1 Tax=Malania oleifera TaxID=397392 RepID=UPI0025AE9DED|nr:protein PHYTOCHROME KINASE SUBSTRATE 4 [Malania oleifera]
MESTLTVTNTLCGTGSTSRGTTATTLTAPLPSLPSAPKLHFPTTEHDSPADDSELSIFDAQKYFNEDAYDDHAHKHNTNTLQCDLPPLPAIRPKLSSASSEASWNSWTGLLPSNPHRSVTFSLTNILPDDNEKKKGSPSAKWIFRRKCPCANKKSVQVLEGKHFPKAKGENVSEKPPNKSIDEVAFQNISRRASPGNHLNFDQRSHRAMAPGRPPFPGGAGFSFSTSIPLRPGKMIPRGLPNIEESEDPPRDSLEVFRPRIFSVTEDEGGSDASSDLFEIESFSTQAIARPRQDSAECYEPSEASVEWSVVTAEGFDRGSLTNFSVSASDAEDLVVTAGSKWRKNGGGGEDGGGRRVGNGLLTSCRCGKAVSVGPGPMKSVGVGGHVGGGGRPVVAAKKPPLAKSHSARLSVTFAA